MAPGRMASGCVMLSQKPRIGVPRNVLHHDVWRAGRFRPNSSPGVFTDSSSSHAVDIMPVRGSADRHS
jgi:hypothetical protein